MNQGRERLISGAAAMGLALEAGQILKLLSFVDLMGKWGAVYNLTAIRDPLEAVELHLLDSLLVSAHLGGAETILDVGTGAGLPGIPLAIAHPERRFHLLDASAKKIRFVRQAILELGLVNVEASACRIEDFHPDMAFDAILARAFASLGEIRRRVSSVLSHEGRILALKAHLAPEELDGLGVEAEVRPLILPGSVLTRHLVIFR